MPMGFTTQHIEKRICQILHYRFEAPPEALVPDANLRDHIGLDSLDLIELVMALEEAYDVTISDEEVENLSTICDVTALVARKIQQR